MRERAEMLGGRLDLRKRPGDGTSIVVTFLISVAAVSAGTAPVTQHAWSRASEVRR
jgi:signal transduction histidine kinase